VKWSLTTEGRKLNPVMGVKVPECEPEEGWSNLSGLAIEVKQ